jgi:hypothetical protein
MYLAAKLYCYYPSCSLRVQCTIILESILLTVTFVHGEIIHHVSNALHGGEAITRYSQHGETILLPSRELYSRKPQEVPRSGQLDVEGNDRDVGYSF